MLRGVGREQVGVEFRLQGPVITHQEGSTELYNWQAEFHGLHPWTHPALESYR